MSDRIHEKYKDAYSEIQPRAEFLEKLTQTIENEQAQQKRSKIKNINVKAIASIAACFAVVVGAVVIMSSSNSSIKPDDDASKSNDRRESSSRTDSSEIDNYGESLSISGLPIRIDDWDAEDMTAQECAEFLESMLSGDELSYVLVSDTNVFTDENEADEQEIENLVQMFADCRESEKLEDEEERVYYMAVFDEGLIIKFNVCDEKYIEIPLKDIYLEVS